MKKPVASSRSSNSKKSKLFISCVRESLRQFFSKFIQPITKSSVVTNDAATIEPPKVETAAAGTGRNDPLATDTETVIIIKPSFPGPSRGFFSMVNQGISNLYDLDQKYSKFYFDFTENALYRDTCFGDDNFFNNYFEQDKALLDSPKKKYIDWITPWSARRDAWHALAIDRVQIGCLVHKHIKIKPRILEKLEAIKREKFQGRNVLGLHKRGTDHGMHGELLGLDFYFSAVDRQLERFDCLYLATDEDDTVRKFKERYKDRLIYVEDFFRSSDGNCIHKHNFVNNYKKGEDVLLEALLLASVNLLLKTRSNVTLFSALYNPNLVFQHIDAHIEYQ